jgi:hypothetical protein
LAAQLRETGDSVTLDPSHAHGSVSVQSGSGSVMDSLKSVPACILAGHLRLSERDDSYCRQRMEMMRLQC